MLSASPDKINRDRSTHIYHQASTAASKAIGSQYCKPAINTQPGRIAITIDHAGAANLRTSHKTHDGELFTYKRNQFAYC
jgi:hypothetical protein